MLRLKFECKEKLSGCSNGVWPAGTSSCREAQILQSNSILFKRANSYTCTPSGATAWSPCGTTGSLTLHLSVLIRTALSKALCFSRLLSLAEDGCCGNKLTSKAENVSPLAPGKTGEIIFKEIKIPESAQTCLCFERSQYIVLDSITGIRGMYSLQILFMPRPLKKMSTQMSIVPLLERENTWKISVIKRYNYVTNYVCKYVTWNI